MAIGVAAGLLRALALADPDAIIGRMRAFLPQPVVRDAETYDAGFRPYPLLTILHIAPGGLFLVLAPFQFSSGLRARNIRLHRWMGRVTVAAGLITGVTGLWLGALFTFTGPAASSAVLVFGMLFLAALILAYRAIRRRDLVRHRDWMIRAFAIALGIATVRIIGLILLATTSAPPLQFLGLSFWVGWLATLGAGELWIRRGPVRLPGD